VGPHRPTPLRRAHSLRSFAICLSLPQTPDTLTRATPSDVAAPFAWAHSLRSLAIWLWISRPLTRRRGLGDARGAPTQDVRSPEAKRPDCGGETSGALRLQPQGTAGTRITAFEARLGLALLPKGQRRSALGRAFDRALTDDLSAASSRSTRRPRTPPSTWLPGDSEQVVSSQYLALRGARRPHRRSVAHRATAS